jgi:hypothetical protein
MNPKRRKNENYEVRFEYLTIYIKLNLKPIHVGTLLTHQVNINSKLARKLANTKKQSNV